MKPSDPILFWTIAAAVGQIAGAVATAAAVIVSLWIVLSERREKLRLIVGHRLIVQRGADHIDVVAFDVTNLSLFPVQLTSFGWRIGWLRRGPPWAQYEWAIQLPDTLGGATLPMTLQPGERTSMLVRLDRFSPDVASSKDLFRLRNVPIGRPRLPPIFGVLHTTRRKELAVRIEDGLRGKMLEIRKRSPGEFAA